MPYLWAAGLVVDSDSLPYFGRDSDGAFVLDGWGWRPVARRLGSRVQGVQELEPWLLGIGGVLDSWTFVLETFTLPDTSHSLFDLSLSRSSALAEAF